MGNIQPTGVKKDDQFQAGAAERAPNQLQPLGCDGGGHDFEATSMLKNCKTNSATDGGGSSSRADILRPAAESIILRRDDSHHSSPPSLPDPEGLQFVLNTVPVMAWWIVDGDGFTAYVKKAADVAVSGHQMAGDTNNNRDPQKYKIRMRGIDAPELKMKYGEESRNELVKLIAGKCVAIYVYGTDQYGRYLGDVYCDGVFIQEQMLKRGFAWHFIFDKRPELAQWEKEAKAARRGLWSSDDPQKPWEWKRNNPRNNKKENADDIQVELKSQGNGKDTETLGGELKKKLDNFVADNMKLNYQLQELKRNKKEAEDRAKQSEKEMKSVVVDKMKLNDQLQESKKSKKEAEDQVLELHVFSKNLAAVNMDLQDRAKESVKEMENVVADNMKLNDQLQEFQRNKKEAEDRAKQLEKEMESVVADNMKLNDQLQESKKNKKEAEDQVLKLHFVSKSLAAVNMDLKDKLEELKKNNKKAKDRAKELEQEMKSVVADNMKLNDQIQKLNKINKMVASFARNSKKKLQRVLVVNMDLNDKLQGLQQKYENADEELDSQKLRGIWHKMSEQAVETPSAPPAKYKKAEDELGSQKLRRIRHKKSEQAVETPSAPPAKGSGRKETTVWQKKMAAM